MNFKQYLMAKLADDYHGGDYTAEQLMRASQAGPDQQVIDLPQLYGKSAPMSEYQFDEEEEPNIPIGEMGDPEEDTSGLEQQAIQRFKDMLGGEGEQGQPEPGREEAPDLRGRPTSAAEGNPMTKYIKRMLDDNPMNDQGAKENMLKELLGGKGQEDGLTQSVQDVSSAIGSTGLGMDDLDDAQDVAGYGAAGSLGLAGLGGIRGLINALQGKKKK